MQKRHPERIIQAWGSVDPFKGDDAIREAKHAIEDLGMLGFHFHPIMGHYAVNDRALYPLFETIDALKAPVMIDVGTTGMGAGMPRHGAKIRHAHPAAIDELAADFPNLTIIAAHPATVGRRNDAVALHKGNVFWELSGWAPKYFAAQLKVDIRARLKEKVMFGSDYPSLPYERILREWGELATKTMSWKASSTATPSAFWVVTRIMSELREVVVVDALRTPMDAGRRARYRAGRRLAAFTIANWSRARRSIRSGSTTSSGCGNQAVK